MKRNGLLVAGGIIGIFRGVIGTIAGFINARYVGQIAEFFPGYQGAFYFEMVLSIAILVGGIWVVIKSNDPARASAIRAAGIALLVAGVIDFFWSIGILRVGTAVIASALGAILAYAVIAMLLIFGSRRLAAQN